MARIKKQREAEGFRKPGQYQPKVLDGDGQAPAVRSVPVPEVTAPAQADFASIKTLDALRKRLKKVRFLPTSGTVWQHIFSPQAVLTQNWGCEGDLARMAEIVLARMGVTTKRVSMALTPKGQAKLAAMAGLTEVVPDTLPGLLYHDGKGNRHILVAPFMEDAAKLSGLVGKIRESDLGFEKKTATITVNLLVREKGGGQAKAGRELSDALSGEADGSEVEPYYLLTANPTLPELSRGGVDLGYTVVGMQSGPVIKAVFDGKRPADHRRRHPGHRQVRDRGRADHREHDHGRTDLRTDAGRGRVHHGQLPHPGAEPAGHDHGRGPAARQDPAVRAQERRRAGQPLGPQVVHAQPALQVRGRPDRIRGRAGKIHEPGHGPARKSPAASWVTVSRPTKEGPVRTSIDLRRCANQIHPSAGATDQARHGFAIMSGLFASRLEADVTPHAMGFFEMLPAFAPDTEFLWLTSDARYRMEDDLKKCVPERVFKLLSDSRATVLFPSQPAVINGEQRWAWLEVDPDSYETIAVLDTGERGAMVERVFGDLWKQGLDYITGGLVGVSSSIWSVSAFSLILDDYKEIMKEAKKFALGLADNFSGSVKVGDFEFKRGVGGSEVETSYSGTGSSVINTGRKAKGLYDKLKDPKIDLGGFEGGFKDGVNFYFSQAGG